MSAIVARGRCCSRAVEITGQAAGLAAGLSKVQATRQKLAEGSSFQTAVTQDLRPCEGCDCKFLRPLW